MHRMDPPCRLRRRPAPLLLARHPAAPEPARPLVGATRADLVIVGGGYTGLWAALLAKRDDPSRDVVVLESDRCGWAASGRNGGFCAASLTHGLANGMERFPDEVATLERLGRQNLQAIGSTVTAEGIDCDFELTGELDVATEPHQVAWLREAEALAQRHGSHPGVPRTATSCRPEIHSPTYLAGLWEPDSCALVDPARLAGGWRAALRTGRAAHPLSTPAWGGPRTGRLLSPADPMVGAHHPRTARAASRVVLATNASPSPVKRLRK